MYITSAHVEVYIRRQSIKEPTFWNSEPASSRSTLATVAMCSGDFKLYSDASSITSCQLVIELDALEWVCVYYHQRFFASWKMKDLAEQRVCVKFCFKLEKKKKNFYGDFSDVATGLWRGLFEPYAMTRVVPAFQIGQNVHRRRPQIWTAFHVVTLRMRGKDSRSTA